MKIAKFSSVDGSVGGVVLLAWDLPIHILIYHLRGMIVLRQEIRNHALLAAKGSWGCVQTTEK